MNRFFVALAASAAGLLVAVASAAPATAASGAAGGGLRLDMGDEVGPSRAAPPTLPKKDGGGATTDPATGSLAPASTGDASGHLHESELPALPAPASGDTLLAGAPASDLPAALLGRGSANAGNVSIVSADPTSLDLLLDAWPWLVAAGIVLAALAGLAVRARSRSRTPPPARRARPSAGA